MIRLPFRSAPRLLPLGRDDARHVAPWLAGLMVYVASAAGIGLILVDDRRRADDELLARTLTVQVPAEASPARLQTVVAVLRQVRGVRSVQLLTPEATGRLLEPWLGAPVPGEQLPVPRLIDVAVERGDTVDMATLRQQVAAVVPEVRVDDNRPFLRDLHVRAGSLQALLGASIGATLLLMALLAVFTTAAALTARRTEIELLHLLGAADRDIAMPCAMRSLRHGLIGGGIGAAALFAALAVLGDGGLLRLEAPRAALGWADWRPWAVLAITTGAFGIVAAASAWATVLRRLARLP